MSDEIIITKSASAPSLSGRGTIEYEIGTIGDEQYIRLSGNSGGGLFSKEWIKVAEIQELLKHVAKPSTSTIRHLYEGKSSNSPGFLLACLFHEKIAERITSPDESVPPSKPAKEKKGKKP